MSDTKTSTTPTTTTPNSKDTSSESAAYSQTEEPTTPTEDNKTLPELSEDEHQILYEIFTQSLQDYLNDGEIHMDIWEVDPGSYSYDLKININESVIRKILSHN